MTHDELRRLIAPYAAATLEETAVDAVRTHLATGCTECLSELYDLPVGLAPAQRTPPAPRAVVAPPPPPRPRVRRARVWSLGIASAVLGATLGAALLWAVGQLQTHDAEIRRLKMSAREAGAERAALTARLEVAERDLASARAAMQQQPAPEQAPAAQQQPAAEQEPGDVGAAAAARLVDLERDLAAARDHMTSLGRGISRRDADIARLQAAADESHALRELLGAPGARFVRLDPQPPFREPHGHVLWNPTRSVLVVYAFDLPRLPAGVGYRLRIVSDGDDVVRPALKRGRGGEVALPIHLEMPAARLRRIEIVREPPGAPVLLGWAAPAAD